MLIFFMLALFSAVWWRAAVAVLRSRYEVIRNGGADKIGERSAAISRDFQESPWNLAEMYSLPAFGPANFTRNHRVSGGHLTMLLQRIKQILPRLPALPVRGLRERLLFGKPF